MSLTWHLKSYKTNIYLYKNYYSAGWITPTYKEILVKSDQKQKAVNPPAINPPFRHPLILPKSTACTRTGESQQMVNPKPFLPRGMVIWKADGKKGMVTFGCLCNNQERARGCSGDPDGLPWSHEAPTTDRIFMGCVVVQEAGHFGVVAWILHHSGTISPHPSPKSCICSILC